MGSAFASRCMGERLRPASTQRRRAQRSMGLACSHPTRRTRGSAPRGWLAPALKRGSPRASHPVQNVHRGVRIPASTQWNACRLNQGSESRRSGSRHPGYFTSGSSTVARARPLSRPAYLWGAPPPQIRAHRPSNHPESPANCSQEPPSEEQKGGAGHRSGDVKEHPTATERKDAAKPEYVRRPTGVPGARMQTSPPMQGCRGGRAGRASRVPRWPRWIRPCPGPAIPGRTRGP